MKKTLLLTAIAAMSLGSAALSPALAAPISAPPQISESAAEDARDQVQAPRRASNYEKLSDRPMLITPRLARTVKKARLNVVLNARKLKRFATKTTALPNTW